MRITIVGCGSIGQKLAAAADEMAEVKRIYIMDIIKEKAEQTASGLKKAIVVDDVEEELYHCDLVIESASQDAVRTIMPKVVARGVDIMITSVGALVDDEFRNAVYQKAKECEARIYIPSGAACGTDGLRSSAVGRLDEVELITTKAPISLKGAPFLDLDHLDLDSIKEPTEIFNGPARDAVKLFPRNVNIAATVSLLGIGFDKTRVRVIVDPATHTNSHELRLKGEFGEMVCHTYNVPDPETPQTSHLAAMSTISALKRIVRNEWFGLRSRPSPRAVTAGVAHLLYRACPSARTGAPSWNRESSSRSRRSSARRATPSSPRCCTRTASTPPFSTTLQTSWSSPGPPSRSRRS